MDLTPAEEKVVKAAAAGTPAIITTGDRTKDDPAQGANWGDERTVRAEVIYALAVGTNPSWPVHAKGVRIAGARIEGPLDFENATLRFPLGLFSCHIAEPMTLLGADVSALYLNGSHLAALHADGVRVRGDVFLRHGFDARGNVRLPGAEIGGNLDCSGGSFSNPGREALSAVGARVRGRVSLRDGFRATGEVSLLGAEIGGSLECAGGSFSNPGREALSAERVRVRGSVFLGRGFDATGEVGLLGARIGGDLDCSGGVFRNPSGYCLTLQGAKIGGTLFLRNLSERPSGALGLAYAEARELVDDEANWPSQDKLFLDGFVYQRLAGDAPTDWKARRRWLALQPRVHPSYPRFCPQPYEQLAKTLRAMGHRQDAKAVLIAKEDERRKRLRGELSWPRRLRLWFTKWTVAYGQKPYWTLCWALGIVLAGWLFVWLGNGAGLMDRVESGRLVAPSLAEGASAQSGHYDRLSPFAYSLDVFLPIHAFHQEERWWPNAATWWGWGLRIWLWVETLSGWGLTLLFVAGLTGYVQRE